LKRFVRSACRKSPSVCPQTTMPATISGSIRGLRSVTIWSIGNYLS
jgi:N-acetylglutamate synthase (EC 2.3.1.1)